MKTLHFKSRYQVALVLAGLLFGGLSRLCAATELPSLSWDVLSGFSCDGDDAKIVAKKKSCEVPSSVVALDSAAVSIQGFMIPFEGTDDDHITAFALVRDQMSCCYGGTPKLNAWIFVKMKKGQFARFEMYEPVTVHGTLGVGLTNLKGKVLNLYRMDAERVKAPKS